MTVTVTQETIGPDDARELLKLNTKNRGLRGGLVESLKRDIKTDRWVLNGETIKISNTGVLLDGQHRLQAVIEADKPITTMVVRGLDDTVQMTVDSGTRRQLHDVLKINGEPNATTLAAAARVSWFLDTYGTTRVFGVQPSKAELLDYFEKNPGLRDAATLGITAPRSTLRIPGSSAAALWYQMSRFDKTMADSFWLQLLQNDAPKGSAIYALRETLLKDLGRPHHMSVYHRLALIIKAWNYWVTGRSADHIQWRGSGERPEGFPKMLKPGETTEEEVA